MRVTKQQVFTNNGLKSHFRSTSGLIKSHRSDYGEGAFSKFELSI